MTQLNYHLSGTDPNKPYLTLLHGLFGSLDNLAMVRKAFVDSHNVLSIDLPDHGRSAHTEQFSFRRYADHIETLLLELKVPTTQIMGHSLGGKIAMQLALDKPNLIGALVVADIAPVRYEPRHQSVFAALNAVDPSKIRSRSHATEIMMNYLTEPGVAQFLLKSLVQENGLWRWQFNLTMLERDYGFLSSAIESENAVSTPTLFIKGGNSDYIKADYRADILRLFPNSSAKIIDAAGHWLHAEKPAVFNRILAKFLDEANTN